MTEEARKRLEEMATVIANEAANPILRDMYPSRSRGQMANEFRHFILTGAQSAWDLATKAERERCAKIVHTRHGNFGVKTANDILRSPESEAADE